MYGCKRGGDVGLSPVQQAPSGRPLVGIGVARGRATVIAPEPARMSAGPERIRRVGPPVMSLGMADDERWAKGLPEPASLEGGGSRDLARGDAPRYVGER